MMDLPQGLKIHPGIDTLQESTEKIRTQIINHPLYKNINSIEDLRIFMSFHIFAVWDFMSLLKSLQQKLTGVSLPWLPTSDPLSRRLINHIVLVEESDIDADGSTLSHFELYLKAMKSCGAPTETIDNMILSIRKGESFNSILSKMTLSTGVFQFLKNTWDLIDKAPTHEVAAVFALAREGLIPDMFMSMSKNFKEEHPKILDPFYYYLERHIEEDEDHAQMAFHMLSSLCKDDTQKWDDAEQAAKEALQARLTLWDAALEEIMRQRAS